MSKSKILFKITGSIAAYKASYLISKLVQAGHDVQVVASPAALNFIGPATLEGLSGKPVISDTFASGNLMDHIHLMRWADAIIVAPATANFINKAAQGVGDDLLTTLFLAHDFKKPYLVAPAMNTAMYLHPITQASVQKLKSLGIAVLETASGVLACGEEGYGKLLDPELIFAELKATFSVPSANPSAELFPQVKTSSDLSRVPKGLYGAPRVLVTSGGTIEPIDSMRVLTNLSTGQTGAQIASHFHALGAVVTQLLARNSAQGSANKYLFYSTFDELDQVLHKELSSKTYDYIIHVAAVSDFKVKDKSQAKICSAQEVTLTLVPNKKIIASLVDYSKNKHLKIVGFKFTATENATEQQKAVDKVFSYPGVLAVVHNDANQIDNQAGHHRFNIHSKSQAATSVSNKVELASQLATLVLNHYATQATELTQQGEAQ